jgi:hypothetical protein
MVKSRVQELLQKEKCKLIGHKIKPPPRQKTYNGAGGDAISSKTKEGS